jgi:hypothetical protein
MVLLARTCSCHPAPWWFPVAIVGVVMLGLVLTALVVVWHERHPTDR